eukprot:c15822_g1_i2.p1 GENE.c15822_g1_i2~~c15822_g1_i2.p1  ORF type:complete len:166 (+),score=79.17 c15822_g1_i2:1-498(+)
MAATLHCTCPPASVIRQGITRAGYQISQSHCSAEAIKTNAPAHVIWDIMRKWITSNPINPREGSVAQRILAIKPKTEIDLSGTPEKVERSNVPRFVPNPENWGPKRAAAGGRFVKLKKQKKNTYNDDENNGEEEEEEDEEEQEEALKHEQMDTTDETKSKIEKVE